MFTGLPRISFHLRKKYWSQYSHYKNKNGQTERLTIRDPELLHAIKKHFGHHRFIGGWKHRFSGSTRTKIFLFLSVTLAIILAGYFFFVPWLGDRIAKSISKEWEINMGQKMHQAVMQEFKVDTVRTQLINFFFKELHYDVQYPVSITVVQSKEVNAFAVPGGPIVVYSSILEKCAAQKNWLRYFRMKHRI